MPEAICLALLNTLAKMRLPGFSSDPLLMQGKTFADGMYYVTTLTFSS